MRQTLCRIYLLIPIFLISFQAFSATITSTGSGNWNSTSTWAGNVVPGSGDSVNIRGGDVVTLNTNATITGISFGTNSSGNAAGLTINTGFTLTVSGSVTVINSTSNKNITANINGQVGGTSGTIICSSIVVGGTNGVITSNQSTTLNSTIGSFQVSGDVNITGVGLAAFTNNANFYLNSGILTVSGQIKANGGLLGGTATFDMAQSVRTGTLNVSAANPITTANSTVIRFSNGTTSATTVNYTGTSGTQQVYALPHDNLILSGSGTKTMPAALTTIYKAFTMSGSASATATVGLTVTGSITLGSGTSFDAGSFTHNVGGSWTNNGAVFTAGTSTINFNNSSSPVSINGTASTAFNQLTINKSAAANAVNSTASAFSANALNVSQGSLTLSATNSDYNINGNLTVSTNGTLTHGVDYDATGRSLVVGGNVDVIGIFAYSTFRSRLLMNTAGKTVRSGTNPLSKFRILVLANTSGTIAANGTVTVDDWLLVGNDVAGGTFNTNGNAVNGQAMYVSGGTVNANSALTLTSGLVVGNNSTGIGNLAGTFNLLAGGSISADAITLAEAGNSNPAGTLNQAAGTTISLTNNDFTINASGVYNCTGNTILNLLGDWNNSGSFSAGTGIVNLNSTTVGQELKSAVNTTFYNLKNNNTNAAGITITAPASANISVSNNLDLASTSNGKIFATDTLSITRPSSPGSAITGANTSRYIVGILSFAYPAGNTANLVYPIGTNSAYAPATLSLNGVSGSVVVAATISGSSSNEDAPSTNSSGISLTNRAPAYWTLGQQGSGSFSTYSSKFDFTNLSATGSTTSYKLREFTSAWSDITPITNSSTDITGTGLTAFGEFVTGEANTLLAVAPADYVICVGDNASFTSGSTSLPTPTVKWQRSVDGVAPFVDVTTSLDPATTYSGFNSATLDLSAPGNTLDNYVYKAVYSNINGTVSSANARLTFTNRPTSVLSGSQTACSGVPVPLSVVLTGTAPWSITYTDGVTPVTINGILASPYTFNVTTTSTATYTISNLTDRYCTGTSKTGSAVITVLPAPSFSLQPTPSTTICATGSASFTITASGNGSLTYAWKKNGNALVNGGNISGVNTITLNISAAVTGDAGVYTCVVTDACNVSSTSNGATLVVNANASVANAGPDQINPGTACGTATLAATAPAVGTGTWTVFAGTGGSFSSTSNPSATFTGTPGNTYTLRWTVTNNSCNTNFDDVIITLNPTPTVTNAATANFCSTTPGSVINLTATVASTFSWTIGTITGGAITGAVGGSGTTIDLSSVSNVSGAPGTVQYRVTPTSTASGCVGAVYTITVTINPEPSVGNQTANICSGSLFTISPVSTGTTYSWPTPVVTGGITGGSAASGQSNISQTLTNPTNVTQTATYTVTPSNNGCLGNTFTVTVTVRPTPTLSATGSETVCSGTAMSSITFSNPNAVSGTTFNWTRDNTTNLTGIAASGSTSPITGTLTNTAITQQATIFTITAAAGGCNAISTTITKTVNPQPTVALSSASQTVCSGNPITAVTITNPNGIAGTTFSWTRDNATNLTGITTPGSGTPISGTLTNTTTSQQITTFTVNANAGGCASTNATSVITVNPTPVVSISNNSQTLCSAVAFTTMTISSNISGSTFAWSRNNTSNLTGALSGSTSSIAGTLTNVTNSQQVTTFTATATAPSGLGNCTSPATATATRTVNPTPLIANQNLSICSGAAFATPLNNAPTTIVPAGTTYTWTVTNNTNVGGETTGTAQASFSQTLTNATTSNQTVVYPTVTPTAGSCVGANFNTNVLVYPAATVNAISNVTTCATYSNPAITFGSNLTGATFSWTCTPNIGFGASGTGNIPAYAPANATVNPIVATVSVTASLNSCPGVARTFTITVNPTAVPTVVTNYCYGGGQISLTPTVVPSMPVTSYFWNSGGIFNDFTNDSLYVDIAGTYYVTVTNSFGCQATDSAIVAEELVSNGDFELGNTGFTTEYVQGLAPAGTTGTGSMYDEGFYRVDTNARDWHTNFWGRDHTSGRGKYLIVNGSPTSTSNGFTVIWQQPRITVTKNTTYYFAAWARSLNSSSPFARLQFRVNGQQVGSIDTLTAVPQNNTGPHVWTRFYGNWNSGNSDTAIVSITDLEQARGGNDFGLDDISFGTLAAKPFTVLAVNSVGGSGCVGKTITLSTTVNSGLSPFTYQWTGPNSFSATTATAVINNADIPNAGKYYISVRDKYGCPITDSTTLTISPQSTITGPGSVGTDNQTVCINNAIANITYSTTNATGATLTGLPTNITGSFSSNTYTVSGIPNIAGTYAYKVKTIANCPDSLSGNLLVQANATLVLTSGSANPAAFCVNTALGTNIVYTAGGAATNVTVSGLPGGMSGLYNSGAKTFTISGTPSVAGSFPYTVTAVGSNCINQALSGTITVTAAGNITLTAGNASPTVCINSSTLVTTPIVYTISGTGTGATLTGSLPTGVTGVYTAGNKQFTISGTPTVAGTFPYTITVSGSSCTNNQVSGTITVTADGTLLLTSAPATSNQTFCFGPSITTITYQYGGTSTGISVNGLPAGLNTVFSGNTLTISGTPSTTGIFNYTVSTSGSTCVNPTLSGNITVNGVATLALTTANATQTVCVSNPIATISYTVGGAGTGATVTGLPNGVTGLYSSGTVTISGSPTQTGTFNFSVVTTGSSCSNPSLGGTITVNDNATLTLTTANASQTVCTGTPIAAIRYTIGGAGTGATVTGLPAGLISSFSAGVLTISGSPTATGTYTVTTTGSSCTNPSAGGTITANPNASITTAGLTAETKCVGNSFTTRTYTIANATGVTLTGTLPPGVTGVYNGTNNTYTLSSTATSGAGAVYSYTLTTTGATCQQAVASGTYTVNIASTIVRIGSSPIQACTGSPVNMQFQLGGGATGASLSAGAYPPNVTGSYNSSTKIFTVSGTPLSGSGSYSFTIRADGSACGSPTVASIINLSSPHTLVRTSAAATANQTFCQGGSITPITYTFGGGATGISVSGLPSGVNAVTSVKNVTISGTPSVTGNFSFTINTQGSCTPASASGTINITPNSTLNLLTAISTTNQKVCINTGIDNIEYQFGGSAGNLSISGLPAGVTYEIVGNVLRILGSPTVGGVFTYTISNIGTCTQSNVTGTITIPNSAAGLWTGLVDNDWFNCANWGNGIVPDQFVDVVIPDNATVNVVIDTNSINVTSDRIATAKSITTGKNLNFTNGAILNVSGDVLIRPGGSINMSSGGEIALNGNWTDNAGANGLIQGTGLVTLAGAQVQTITGGEIFNNLKIDQDPVPGTGVTLAGNVTVSNTLTLNQGVVNTRSQTAPSLGLLTLGPNAAAVAGTPGTNSYINGAVAKDFTTPPTVPYVLPVGNATAATPYRPASVLPSGSSATGTTTFTAEYIPAIPPLPGNTLGTVVGLGTAEYWQIDRTATGTPLDAKVILGYTNPGSSNWSGLPGGPCAQCPVAIAKLFLSPGNVFDYWDFSKNAGFDPYSPEFRYPTDNGPIYSDVFTSFGAFGFGYGYDVILAVKLVYFEGKTVNHDGVLSWKVSGGAELQKYELESGTDGTNFRKIAEVAETGKDVYKYVDQALSPGLHYYRLAMIPKNGRRLYSNIVLLKSDKQPTRIIGLKSTVVTNQLQTKIYSAIAQKVHAQIFDIAGHLLGEYKGELKAGNNEWPLNIQLNISGMYFIRVTTEDDVKGSLRFFKQ